MKVNRSALKAAQKSLLAAVLLMPTLSWLGCARPHTRPPAESLPSRTVKVAKVGVHGQGAQEEVVGTVKAKVHATIEAKTSGRIIALPVRMGQNVKKGALLVGLDAGDVQARFDQARAVHAQAKIDLDRMRSLVETQAATRNDLDNAQSKYQIAEAALAETRSLLGHARLTAPFSGIITQKLVDVGDLAVPGKALVEMEQPGELRLNVNVPEALIGSVTVGSRLPVSFENGAPPVIGTVDEVAPAADVNTRSFLVTINLPSELKVHSGQLGHAYIAGKREGLIRIPKSAVVERGQLEIVFVVENQKAKLRLIKTAKQYDTEVEVASGLQPNDVIVIDTPDLRDGQPVEVKL